MGCNDQYFAVRYWSDQGIGQDIALASFAGTPREYLKGTGR